ncbi:hypothetical protein IWGMT90018_31610 [Mycobacterium kiyosense]|nr:hypothetical protein IWGMT90018_31610 [Mycobacterium kiyosense]
MSGNAVRLQAINSVEAFIPPAISFVPGETPGEVFGSNVFTKAEMQARLPKTVFKSIVATIEKGAKLDPAVADTVAVAMKDWALEKRRHPLRARVLPDDRPDGREARQFPRARLRRADAGGVRRQDPDPG